MTPVSLNRHIRPKRKFALTRDSKRFTINFISFTYQSDMLVELYHRFPIMSIGNLKKFKILANVAARLYNLIINVLKAVMMNE